MSQDHILIVDDEKFVVDLISTRLAAEGFKVSGANSGEEALNFLKTDKPDLVILDCLMPGMDGYEVLRRMRADKKNMDLPVIMLTANLKHSDKVKGLEMGLDDHMTKPYEGKELVARINAVLKRAKASTRIVKNILVTGGAGFIGSALVRKLLDKKYNVAVIDDFSSGSLENLKGTLDNKNFHLITGSITDETIIGKAVEECDLIYHLAATVGVKNVVDKPLETIIYDTIGTSIVLKYASARGVKTLITSTSEVYGKSKKYPFKEGDDVVIGPPDINRWSYACSKLLDEFFAIGYYKERGLPITIVRLFNVVGPGQVGSYGMVMPRFFKFALKNEPIPVYGDGKQVRCFTYVDDAIDIIIKLAGLDAANGEVINLGAHNEISIKDLAQEIKKITKSSSKIVFEPYRKYYGASFQDIKKRVPDLAKLKRISGTVPKTTLKEILEKMNLYFKENPAELDRI
ncbi:MAG: GDP-mannose 4,6-dehydratase [Candidatus Omnitrophota bacterium]|nr:GDP-mannose 4,6-dehydratase [Candidatus Omnitrophota bacterium]